MIPYFACDTSQSALPGSRKDVPYVQTSHRVATARMRNASATQFGSTTEDIAGEEAVGAHRQRRPVRYLPPERLHHRLGSGEKRIHGVHQGRFPRLDESTPQRFQRRFPAEPGEAWSRYRIFGGSSTVVLRAESLALNFPNIVNTDQPVVREIVRRALNTVLPALGGYERHSYSVASNYHVEVVGDRVDSYLARHASREIEEAARGQPATEFRPTIGFTLRSSDGFRVFRRTIEQSEVLENGLFIANRIFVSMPDLTTFDEEIGWTDRIGNLANTAAGITYLRDEADDDAGA